MFNDIETGAKMTLLGTFDKNENDFLEVKWKEIRL